jgi:hypothetical protein
MHGMCRAKRLSRKSRTGRASHSARRTTRVTGRAETKAVAERATYGIHLADETGANGRIRGGDRVAAALSVIVLLRKAAHEGGRRKDLRGCAMLLMLMLAMMLK